MSKYLLNNQKIAALPVTRVQHQFNDNAIRSTKTLSSATGLQRLGIHLVTICQGNDSTTMMPTKNLYTLFQARAQRVLVRNHSKWAQEILWASLRRRMPTAYTTHMQKI